DLIHGDVAWHVHCLGYGAGDEGLDSGHHLDVAHVVYAPRPLSRLECAIENRQVFLFEVRSAFYCVVVFEILENLASLGLGIAELGEGFRNSIVDYLDYSASHEPLVFDQGNVRFDAGGVAVHHERDRSSGCDDGYLGVLESKSLSQGESVIPRLEGGFQQLLGDSLRRNLVSMRPVHVDHVEEWLLIDSISFERAKPLGYPR